MPQTRGSSTRKAARQMMKEHLDQVIEQAVNQLQDERLRGRCAAPSGPFIRHILEMATCRLQQDHQAVPRAVPLTPN